MPITEITIENFKGIGSKQTIPLRPITLLFGGNSAGKSTILQALHLFKEVLRTGSAEVDKLIPGTPNLDIGGFQQYVHNHDFTKPVRISVSMSVDDDGLPTYHKPHIDDDGIEVFNLETAEFDISSVGVNIEIRWDQVRNQSFVSCFETFVDGKIFSTIEKNESSEVPTLIRLESTHECIENMSLSFLAGYPGRPLENLAENFKDLDYMEKQDATNYLMKQYESRNDSLHETVERIESAVSAGFLTPDEGKSQIKKIEQAIEEAIDFTSSTVAEIHLNEDSNPIGEHQPDQANTRLKVFLHGKPIIPLPRESFFRDSDGAYIHEIEDGGATDWFLTRLITGSADLIRHELEGTRYIGSLRTIPERGYQGQSSISPDRWANGLAAWDLLSRANKDTAWLNLDKVNSLDLGCTLTETSVFEGRESQLINLQNRWVHTFEPPNLNQVSEEINEFCNRFVIKRSLSLSSIGGKAKLEPCDVGVGVSQVIPVVIGVQEPNHSILMVEQPELHIHPRVQCNLGDVLAHQAVKNPSKIQLLETHSEHLILRFLRRIREQYENELPPDAPKLTPEHLSVLYINQTDEGVEVTQLPVTEDGDFAAEWPKGFFEERFDEYEM